ncbi:hypothetical protein [Stenotrophomonas panacihumi]|uniref:hypothetical protein n=1 Tax=Stenotrophomonas panacihumi TaxID=676599 RepID=UPI0015E64D1F|nr:hypothetical protein [Stenotrophomonas panacihumi]
MSPAEPRMDAVFGVPHQGIPPGARAISTKAPQHAKKTKAPEKQKAAMKKGGLLVKI